MESREEKEAVATLEVRFVDRSETLDVNEEEKLCPECGRKMSLVAAGWYCMRDDVLIDPVTGKPVEALKPKRVEAGPPEIARPTEIKARGYDRSIDGDLPLISPIIVTAFFCYLEATRASASASVYHYSFYAIVSSAFVVGGLFIARQKESVSVARFVIVYVLMTPMGLEGLRKEANPSIPAYVPAFVFLSFFTSIGLDALSTYWSKKKGGYWMAKPYLWVLTIWYIIVGVSLLPSAAITFGPPEDITWWPAIALSGLGALVSRMILMFIPPSGLEIFGGVLYAFGFFLLVQSFPPSTAVWAFSICLVVMYLGLLIPSIRWLLTEIDRPNKSP